MGRMGCNWAFAAILCLWAAGATPAWASIYLDEDFEGVLFVDRDWPVRSADEPEPTEASVALMGVNLRVGGDSDGSRQPKVQVVNEGAVSELRSFHGARSLALNNGSISVGPDGHPAQNKSTRAFRVLQFALSVDQDSLAVADGTIVGRIQQDWSTNGNLNTVDYSLVLHLVKNDADDRIDLICQNNDALLGRLQGIRGDWLVVTIVNNIGTMEPTYEVEQTVFMSHVDPFTDEVRCAEMVLPTGIHIFASSQTPMTYLTYEEINAAQTGGAGSRWGNSNLDTDQTAELGWSIASLAGTDIFIDNLYWDCGYHSNPSRAQEMEQAARMTTFDDPGTESAISGVGSWSFYE